jgi:Tat protein translocase TatB subunit
MNSFFGIGFAELFVILVLAGLLLGPHRIRQVARALGRLTAQLQGISRQFSRQLNAELDASNMEEIRGAIEDVKNLQQQVESLRRELKDASQEFMREGNTAVREGVAAVSKTGELSRDMFPPNQIGALSESEAEAEDNAAPPLNGSPLPRAIQVPGDPEI